MLERLKWYRKLVHLEDAHWAVPDDGLGLHDRSLSRTTQRLCNGYGPNNGASVQLVEQDTTESIKCNQSS